MLLKLIVLIAVYVGAMAAAGQASMGLTLEPGEGHSITVSHPALEVTLVSGGPVGFYTAEWLSTGYCGRIRPDEATVLHEGETKVLRADEGLSYLLDNGHRIAEVGGPGPATVRYRGVWETRTDDEGTLAWSATGCSTIEFTRSS